MKSCVIPRFWQQYELLAPAIQRKADKAYALWHQDTHHPSLHFKKVGKYWSVRVDDNHRAIADIRGDTAYWLWIGSHEGYMNIIAANR